MTKLLLTFLFASGLWATNVVAGADCPDVPQSQWMSALELQKKIVNEYGFEIKKFKIDDNCYEIYGWDHKDGKRTRVEVYFNPVNGEIVKKKEG